jgi:broad specificity phosphatase PhoE
MIYLVRHGETQWSLSGRHTSRTDIALTENGEEQARKVGNYLRQFSFASVMSSSRLRAVRTCELAALGMPVAIDSELSEWNYGDYEGLRSADIEKERPQWNLWTDGCPNGESPEEVSARADSVIQRLRSIKGNIAVFSHGHFCCALATRWIEQPIRSGQHLELGPGTVSILAFAEHHASVPTLRLWNASM